MSTPENTTPTDGAASDGTAPDTVAADTGAADAPERTGAREGEAPPAVPDAPAAESRSADAFLEGGRRPAAPGLLSAETFALAALLFLAPVATDPRLFELFGWFAFTDITLGTEGNLAAVNADLLAYGGLGVLAVLAASLSLVLGRGTTRAWARWLAAATVLTGTVFVVLAIVTYTIAAGRV
ncbi:hypothetical protein ACFVWN_13035 [Nocardiopsis flavescens]|uniref:hypothetical protein n=1 Tax=Nocardiopsis flavescens TaxID=758803 RepID=UPI003646FC1A